jgi:pSer/pThr/pTyr-binding forkhead associated (FHA) protein
MSLLITLNRLESHLRTLVEGSLARLFPAPDLRRELVERLMHALRQEVRPAPGGQILAPDRFTIFLPPKHAATLTSHPDLLAELAHDLSQAAAETGVTFAAEPSVRVLPERETAAQISVLAQFTLSESLNDTHGTAALAPLPAQEAASLFPAIHGTFLLLENGRVFPLESPVTNLGSAPENQLCLPDARLAPLHAQIRLSPGHCTLFNLALPGSTLVNNLPVSQRELQTGDVISLGGVNLIFGQESPSTPPDDTQPFP